jgi:SAM-dependent methyltransferase
MKDSPSGFRLYGELASWWSVLSPREGYGDVAGACLGLLQQASNRPIGSVLELGCGPGHLASHIDTRIEMVLVDRSPEMIAVSQSVNPTRAHVVADFCELDLGRTFDAVLLHDAVMYLTTPELLDAALRVMMRHVAPGGSVLVVPDVLEGGFEELSICGGGTHEDGRSAQLMEWHRDPDPTDGRYTVDFAAILCPTEGRTSCVHEQHEHALHSADALVRGLRRQGFEMVDVTAGPYASQIPFAFLARRPADQEEGLSQTPA